MSRLFAGLAGLVDPTAPLPTVIGLATLLPLLAAALLIPIQAPSPFDPATVISAMVGYGAVLLSMLGGVRWGMALRPAMGRRQSLTLAAGLLPVLVGWVALFLPAGPALGLLAAAFAGQGAWDVWAVEAGSGPPWYGRLRILFTVLATTILAVTLMVVGV